MLLKKMFLKGLEKIRRKFSWSPIYEILRPADSTQNKLLLSSATYNFLLSFNFDEVWFYNIYGLLRHDYICYIFFRKLKRKKQDFKNNLNINAYFCLFTKTAIFIKPRGGKCESI